MFLRRSLWPCIALLTHSYLAHAAIVSRTIDDTHGDLDTGSKPIYVPSEWQNDACGGCQVKPPTDKAFLRTYSAFTSNPDKFPTMSIELKFKGTAIYVYFILANSVGNENITTETTCEFHLDGNEAVKFDHRPTASTEFDFDALVFSKENLANDDHTLRILAIKGESDNHGHSYIAFDYAKYTFDDTPPPPPPPQTTSTPPPDPTTTSSTSTTATTGTNAVTSNTPTTSTSTSSSTTSPSITSGGASNRSSSRDGTKTASSASSSSSVTSIPVNLPSDEPNGNPSHPFPLGAVVGGVVGGIAMPSILLLLLLYRRRRRRASSSEKAVPFTIDGAALDGQEAGSSSTSQYTSSTFDARKRPPFVTIGASSSSSTSQYTPSTFNARKRPPFVTFGASSSSQPSSEALSHSRDASGGGEAQVTASGDASRRAGLPLGALGTSDLRPLRRDGDEVVQMRTQLHAMAQEIEHLHSQLNSNPTQRLSRDPPPGYSL